MAKRQREEALARYYANPVYCKQCGKVVVVTLDNTAAETRRKVFCNRSCAATYQGLHRPPKYTCLDCGVRVSRNSSRCMPCYRKHKSVASKSNGVITKGELFTKRKGYQSARNGIRRHAKCVFDSMNITACQVCGYTKHIDAAHKRSVSSFPDEATLLEINSPDNLIGLCPNCHWEYDHDLISL